MVRLLPMVATMAESWLRATGWTTETHTMYLKYSIKGSAWSIGYDYSWPNEHLALEIILE